MNLAEHNASDLNKARARSFISKLFKNNKNSRKKKIGQQILPLMHGFVQYSS
jgi:hypothetical protein